MLRNLQCRLPGATVRVSDAHGPVYPGTRLQCCSLLLSLAHLPFLACSQAHSDLLAATVVRGQHISEPGYRGRCSSTHAAFEDTFYLG